MKSWFLDIVKGNSFVGSGAGGSLPPEGIIVNQSGTSDNRIYRNTFSDLGYGIKAQGTNGNATNGLVFKCNDFSEDKYDIAVTSGAINTNQGADLGTDVKAPAGNIFTADLATSTLQYAANSGVSSFTYFHHHDASPASAPFYAPYEYSTSKITLHDCTPDYDANSCPSSYIDGGGFRLGSSSIREFKMFAETNFKTESEDSPGISYTEEISFQRNNLIRSLMVANLQDSIVSVINNDSTGLAETLESAIEMYNGNIDSAIVALDGITNDSIFIEEGFNPTIYQIDAELKMDSLFWNDISAEQLNEISNSNGPEASLIKVRLLLENIIGESYEEPIEYIVNDIQDTTIAKMGVVIGDRKVISISPNPVTINSMLFINNSVSFENSVLMIYSSTGEMIWQMTLPTNTTIIPLPYSLFCTQGIYIAVLIENSIVTDSIKFIYI